MIPAHTISAIRSHTDLPSLVREYGVDLKRASGGYVGKCPFHSEATASFRVHSKGARRGSFKCFGCQASGSSIDFLMRIENWSFPRAAKVLALRAGIEIADTPPISRVERLSDTEDAAMHVWWLRKRQEAARALLDVALADGPPGNREDYDWARCLGRLSRAVVDLQEFKCLVTVAERREWLGEVAEAARFDEAWLSLARHCPLGSPV